MTCSKCGCNYILADYYEDEWYFWCGHCGKEINQDEVDYEINKDNGNKTPPNNKRKKNFLSLLGGNEI